MEHQQLVVVLRSSAIHFKRYCYCWSYSNVNIGFEDLIYLIINLILALVSNNNIFYYDVQARSDASLSLPMVCACMYVSLFANMIYRVIFRIKSSAEADKYAEQTTMSPITGGREPTGALSVCEVSRRKFVALAMN